MYMGQKNIFVFKKNKKLEIKYNRAELKAEKLRNKGEINNDKRK